MIAGSKGGFVHTMTKSSYDYPRLQRKGAAIDAIEGLPDTSNRSG